MKAFYVKKITGKLFTKPDVIEVHTPFCRLGGKATSFKMKHTEFGDSPCFRGDFFGVNANGILYRAPEIYLPAICVDEVLSAFSEDMAENETVNFVFDIFLEPAKTEIGYSYSYQPIHEPVQHREVDRLKDFIEIAASFETEMDKKMLT